MGKLEIDFRLIREMGRGATARVWLAQRLSGGQESVAIKIFHAQSAFEGPTKERLRRESETLRRLAHPRIIRIHETDLDSDPPFLVMDYVDGENFQAIQARLPYVLPEVSALLALDLLAPLAHAHGRGVVHRDLKPENILVSREGHIFLTDFGVAQTDHATRMTQPGSIVGSLDYLSPEQALGDTVGPQSDLFSLSAILYFLVTGTRPFSRPTPAATLRAIEKEMPDPPQQRNPKLSRKLAGIILKGLEKNPAKRFQSAQEMSEAIRLYLQELDLGILFPSFADWFRFAPESTLEGLSTAAAALASCAEKCLTDKRGDELSEVLAHLSLKAPESPVVPRLLGEWNNVRAKRSAHAARMAAIAIVVVGSGVGVYLKTKHKAESPTVVVASPSVPAAAAPSAPVAPVTEAVVVPAVEASTVPPLSRRYSPLSRRRVIFELSEDITASWDGRRVSPGEILKNEKIGKHFLRLEKEGHPPITSDVWVKSSEPTVIVAKE